MHYTIVVIEDIPDMAQYMQDILSAEGHQVYTSTTGAEGLRLIEDIQPELVLLDLRLPDLDGKAVCKQVKRDFPDIQVIMVTGQDTPESVAHGLNIGADDYITKPVDPHVLIARVNARMRTTTHSSHQLSVGDLTLDRKTHEVKRGEQSIQLSAQEYKLLDYLMENPNTVLTREMILSRIWKSSPDIQTRVVDVYIGYLRKKIDAKKKPQLIHSVRGFGYMLSESQPQT